MAKIPGINHLIAVRALEKAGFSVVRQAKHIVMNLEAGYKPLAIHSPREVTTYETENE